MSSPTPLSRFIDLLQQADLEMTAEELAETWWLADQIAQKMAFTAPLEQVDGAQPPGSDPLPPIATPPVVPAPPRPEPPLLELKPVNRERRTGDIYSLSPTDGSGEEARQGGRRIRVPTASAIGNALALGRALRPLKRMRPSHNRFVLNERATAQRIAETEKKAWIPVVEPAPTRFFDLALVIDEGASMVFWQRTVAELHRLLLRLGAFYDIRLWRLATDDREQIKLYAGMGLTTSDSPAHPFEELIDPAGRRLILVVTDCVSPAWHSGKVQEVLEKWGQKNLVTLMQVLPYWLWWRTALARASAINIFAPTSGAANARLKIPAMPSRSAGALPIPVVTLDEESLACWAKLVSGRENSSAAGVLFGQDFSEKPDPQEEKDDFSAEKRVSNFLTFSSESARHLAVYLSAAPEMLTLPIVHLIQRTMVPDATQAHVAEVFLGGLLREVEQIPVTPSGQALKMTAYEDIQFQFLEGVRAELRCGLLMEDEDRVLKAVSRFMSERLGLAPDFPAHVITSPLPADFTIPASKRPFARIAAEVWRKRGYTSLANEIERRLQPEPEKGPQAILRRIRSEWPPNAPVLNRTWICPSCFTEVSIANCKIVSGKTLDKPYKVLKEVPESRWERQIARLNPERLYSAEYTEELAQRQCPECEYLFPYNIELVKNITLAVVGDVFTGKSHYIAALLQQMRTEWIGKGPGYNRMTCLTPEIEKELLPPVIQSTAPATQEALRPLIYEFALSLAPQELPTRFNLIIYDVSGEDYHNKKLVHFARFVFDAGAFIFLADPVMMVEVFSQFPLDMRADVTKLISALNITEERRGGDMVSRVISLYERYHGYSTGDSLSDVPVAVMISKSDLLDYLDLPARYRFMTNPHYEKAVDLQDIDKVDEEVRAFLTNYHQADLIVATNRFRHVSFFASSATSMLPGILESEGKLEPRRCLDPVLWILYHLGIVKAKI